MGQATAAQLIERLRLQPHPEGGHYRETFRDAAGADGRAKSTAILFLLQEGEVSHWHRVDAAEIWHYHAGGAMEISISEDARSVATHTVWHPDVISVGAPASMPQAVVPPGAWQSARTYAPWSLVGCTVAPGFEFAAFELAPPSWAPGNGDPLSGA
ncbi:MAG: cupin domain-containing protein [Pseudomonadota bacterium]